jgi:hypothetical protein
MILKSEMNPRNKITAIGTLAVPILRYSFGVINWRLEEVNKLKGKLERCEQCIKCIVRKLAYIGYM